MQEAWVQSLVRELDPTYCNLDGRSLELQLRPSTAKQIINKINLLKNKINHIRSGTARESREGMLGFSDSIIISPLERRRLKHRLRNPSHTVFYAERKGNTPNSRGQSLHAAFANSFQSH